MVDEIRSAITYPHPTAAIDAACAAFEASSQWIRRKLAEAGFTEYGLDRGFDVWKRVACDEVPMRVVTS